MRVHVSNTLADLTSDLRRVASTARRDMALVVRRNAEQGNRIASRMAKKSAGSHGKHYHRAFSAEAIDVLSWEYGPDASKPQGGMSFERGSRNQPPHNDMARSADIQVPAFADDAAKLPDKWFWPES